MGATVQHSGQNLLTFQVIYQKDQLPNQHLYRFPLPDTRIGNPKRLYTLGIKGRSYLTRLGTAVNWHYQPSAKTEMAYGYFLHPLTLTRVLTQAVWFVKNTPDIALPRMKIEYELRTTLAHLQEAKHAIPDA